MTNISHSLSQDHFALIYADSTGHLQLDQDDSLKGSLTRFCTSILGWRNYNLLDLLPKINQQLSPDNIQFLTKKVAHKVGLQPKELRSIQQLSQYYFNPKQTCKEDDQHTLKTFLTSTLKTSRISRAIHKIQDMNISIDRVHPQALKTIELFSKEIKRGKQLSKSFKKLTMISHALQSDGTLKTPLKQQDKLSLKQLKQLEKVSCLAPIFRDFKKMGIQFDRNDHLEALKKKINLTDNTLRRLENINRKNHSFSPFSFIFYDLPNFTAKKPSKLHPIVPYIFRYLLKTTISHASFSYENSQKQEMEAHILGEITQTKRPLSSSIYKTFNPNMKDMFFRYPKTLQTSLKQLYGPDWQHVLTTKYHHILQLLFKNPTYEDMPSSVVNQFIASAGLGCMLSKGPLQKKFRISEYQGCICAEFILKSLGQAYTKLEKEIQNDFHKHAQRTHTQQKKPKLPPFLSPEQITSSKTPAGLARTLIDSKLITEKTHSKILSSVIQYKTYDIQQALNLTTPWSVSKKFTPIIPHTHPSLKHTAFGYAAAGA